MSIRSWLESPLGAFFLGTVVVGTIPSYGSERKSCLELSQGDLLKYNRIGSEIYWRSRQYFKVVEDSSSLVDLRKNAYLALQERVKPALAFNKEYNGYNFGEVVDVRGLFASKWIPLDIRNGITKETDWKIPGVGYGIDAIYERIWQYQGSLPAEVVGTSDPQEDAKLLKTLKATAKNIEMNTKDAQKNEQSITHQWEKCSNLIVLLLHQYGVIKI